MSVTKNELLSLRRRRIDPGDARPRGLRAVFDVPPDESDMVAHIVDEMCSWVAELDFRLGKPDCEEGDFARLAKLLLAAEFNVDPSDPRWWESLAQKLLSRQVRQLMKRPSKKKHGAPLEWTDQRYCELFADIEYLKRSNGISVRKICETLPRRTGYAERWGRHRSGALRKRYTEANKLRRGVLFQFILCGAAATIPANGIDHIEAGIKRHALKR
jgi:hypothetical protein